MTRNLHAKRSTQIAATGLLIIFIFAVMMMMKSPQVHAQTAQDTPGIDIGATADKIRQEISAPITAVGVIALVIGGAVYAFSRGSAEKTRQARSGLAAAIVGFLIAVFATGVLGTAKSWISNASPRAPSPGYVSTATTDPGSDVANTGGLS